MTTGARSRAKIDEIDAIWEELEMLALQQVSPQPLRSQLSAITRNLSRNGSHAPEHEHPANQDIDRERMAS